MNDEILARAKKLKEDIEHYKWQLKYIDELGKSSVKLVVAVQNGNHIEIPNEDTKQFILGYLAGEYTRLLNKAVKEFEVL